MTTLAGAVPRMMRPGPGQNYPRSGFPLEGKGLPAPGPLRPPRALCGLLPRAQRLRSLAPPPQKETVRATSAPDFLSANETQFSPQSSCRARRPGLLRAGPLSPVVLEKPWRGRDEPASERQRATSPHFVHPKALSKLSRLHPHLLNSC